MIVTPAGGSSSVLSRADWPLVEPFRPLDDRDAAPPSTEQQSELGDQAADRAGLRVRPIAMRICRRRRLGRGGGGRHVAPVDEPAATNRRDRAGHGVGRIAQEPGGEVRGERRLADPGRPGDQEGVRRRPDDHRAIAAPAAGWPRVRNPDIARFRRDRPSCGSPGASAPHPARSRRPDHPKPPSSPRRRSPSTASRLRRFAAGASVTVSDADAASAAAWSGRRPALRGRCHRTHRLPPRHRRRDRQRPMRSQGRSRCSPTRRLAPGRCSDVWGFRQETGLLLTRQIRPPTRRLRSRRSVPAGRRLGRLASWARSISLELLGDLAPRLARAGRRSVRSGRSWRSSRSGRSPRPNAGSCGRPPPPLDGPPAAPVLPLTSG